MLISRIGSCGADSVETITVDADADAQRRFKSRPGEQWYVALSFFGVALVGTGRRLTRATQSCASRDTPI